MQCQSHYDQYHTHAILMMLDQVHVHVGGDVHSSCMYATALEISLNLITTGTCRQCYSEHLRHKLKSGGCVNHVGVVTTTWLST